VSDINRLGKGKGDAAAHDGRRSKLELARQRLKSGYYLSDEVLEATAEVILKENSLRLLSS